MTTALDWLFARQQFGVRPGLERVRALLADVGDPSQHFRVVLVGGTNGKGSTSAALASCLSSDPARTGPTGLFTSPHLERLSERFVIDGAPVDEAALDAALRQVMPFAERREATFFEVVTVVATVLFAAADVSVAVFEVGLGGRWDATNVLEPEHSVITGVSYDHMDVLGSELTGIARDKAGILRPGVPASTGATGVAGETIAAEAERVGAPLARVGHEIRVHGRGLGWQGRELDIDTPHGRVRATTQLLGAHQDRNLALAAAVALRWGVPEDHVAEGIAAVRWPGRLERFEVNGRHVVLDGAHNPEAAEALVDAMQALGAAPYTLVLGVGRDKDVESVVRALTSQARVAVVARATRSPRASAPEDLAERVAATGAEATIRPVPREALDWAVQQTPVGGTVLVAGSLYLVGEVRSLLARREPEPYPRLQ